MGATTPEQRLAAAILTQAFTDMFLPDSRDSTASSEAEQAMRYLTAHHGSSARWRNHWCSCLNLDGNQFAARVRMILDGEIAPPGDVRFQKSVALARDRWARLPSPQKSSDKPVRLPTVRSLITKPSIPRRSIDPEHRSPTIRRHVIDPEDMNLTIPDDPFYTSRAGHMCASRLWDDGEVSRYLGPLPPIHSKLGQVLWTICQIARVGRNSMHILEVDPTDVIQQLQEAIPACEVRWTLKGRALLEYQPNASLRLYLKKSGDLVKVPLS